MGTVGCSGSITISGLMHIFLLMGLFDYGLGDRYFVDLGGGVGRCAAAATVCAADACMLARVHVACCINCVQQQRACADRALPLMLNAGWCWRLSSLGRASLRFGGV
jgi:hypothetical protein